MTLRQRILSFDRSLSASEVARAIGVTRNTVIGHRWRARQPVRVRVYRPRPRPSLVGEGILELLTDGRVWTAPRVAARLGSAAEYTQRLMGRYVAMGLISRVGFGLYRDESE